MIAVVLVQRQGVMRESLLEMLDQEQDLLVTKAFASSADVPPALTSGPGERVVLCDSALVDTSDIERWTAAGAGVVVVADPADEHVLVPAVVAGARGWVSTGHPYSELPQTVRCVAYGGSQVPSEQLAHLLTSLAATSHGNGAQGAELLTEREQQVLQLLADGRTKNEIAGALQVSKNTVRTHVRRILSKLEVHSALTAVTVGRRLGLLHPPH